MPLPSHVGADPRDRPGLPTGSPTDFSQAVSDTKCIPHRQSLDGLNEVHRDLALDVGCPGVDRVPCQVSSRLVSFGPPLNRPPKMSP